MTNATKRFALLLALLMVFSLLGGCGCGKPVENTKTADFAGEETEFRTDAEASQKEEKDIEVFNSGDLLQITVDQIAELNNCSVEDLNITYDDKGRITFIGNRFSTEKILDEDDACKMLAALLDLASIDVELHYYGVSESRITGNRYYSFYQSEEIEPEPGVKMLIDTNTGCIKLITDSEGNTIGLSSCVGGKEQEQTYPRETWVSREEAREYVSRFLDDGESIIDELTDAMYLDDEGCILKCGILSKRLPVWVFVTDYSLVPGWKGTMYCVSMLADSIQNADGTTGRRCCIAQYISIRTPDRQGIEEIYDNYTSLAYFDNMQDAGNYTFHVDESTWVTDAKEGYAFKQYDVTVPLMYDTAMCRYVMGDYQSKIMVSDFHTYYATGSASPNMLVSETPEDIGSWHWARPDVKLPDGSSIPLFLNMDYALSSYSTLLKVHENYRNQLDVDSYDGDGIPQMLALYMTSGNAYPTDEQGFKQNASNYGIYSDWAIMATSPCGSYCADETVLAHEYAHGIDRSNSALKAGNLTGSVEEAFADILSLGINNASYQTDNTQIVHEYSPSGVMRDIADPLSFQKPRFIGDQYYLNEVDMNNDTIADMTDYGGVHCNCAVTTYLAYAVSKANTERNGEPLEWNEIAELFYEASFCRTTDYGYDELGAFLSFAAEKIGLNEEKQSTLKGYLEEYGFCSALSGLEKTLDETGIPKITITADMDDKMEGRALWIDDGGTLIWGFFGKEPLSVRVSDELQGKRFVNLLSPYVNGPENGRVMWMMIDPAEMLLKGDVSIHVSTVMVEPGENYSFGEEVITKRENVDLGRIQMDSTGEGATILKPCEILVSGLCREDGFNLYHVICGTPEEIDQELEREKVPQTLAELASDGDIHTVPLTVINELGKTIKVLNFAQPSAETWGNNPLSDSPLESGTSGTIKFNFNRESLIWDIRVILDDEDSWTFNGNDFSGADPEKGIILRFYWNDQGGMSVKYS